MALKKIINDKPKVGDISQYNFDDGYSTTPVEYDDSTGLPKNNDKFQNKDLFTNCVGDEINDAIIEANLKFQGDPYIKIENLYISNTGVHGTVKSNRVAAWIFSEAAYGSDPTKDGYSTLKSKLWNDDNEFKWKFFDSGFGSKGEGSDIGNITNVEGTPIVSNFGIESSEITVGDFDGSELEVGDVTNAFELHSSEALDDLTQTSIINESQYNPIYIVIYMRGHKKVAWPVNTDERKRKYSIFKISNDELFEKSGTGTNVNYIGKVYQTNFTSPTKTRTGDGGGGATSAAWKVTSLQLSINTTAGVENNFSGVSNYKQFIPLVLPKTKITENSFNGVEWLGNTNPSLQLDNLQESGDEGPLLRHPDFIPFTTFGFSQNNQLGNNYVDLQSYNYDFDLIMKSSSPLNVTFNIDIKGIDENNLTTLDTFYYYFVIDWNDTEEKFKTIENWLDSKPENAFDYLEKQNENLYKIYSTRDSNTPNNVYTTPGIKNIKFIMLSVFDGDNLTDDSPDFEVGRWKLCTSRIYIDIPPNQYPDFGDVGGSDYTTLPWPFTTPIIGGVGDDSKYKKSIQNTLGGGKIGELDIIDERFLVNDLENDEMGKNIETMDLEQCRYFDKPYGINSLLNIDVVIDNELIPFNDLYYDGETNKFPMESSVGQIFISDNLDLNLKQSCRLELNTGETLDKSIIDSSGNSNKGLLIGDYKVKKVKKGQSMRRDSFIKVPKKTGNTEGAL